MSAREYVQVASIGRQGTNGISNYHMTVPYLAPLEKPHAVPFTKD